MSTTTLRNLSAGPRWERSPLYNLSFSSSSAVGAIFNRVWTSSAGSSLPDQYHLQTFHREVTSAETDSQTHRITNMKNAKCWMVNKRYPLNDILGGKGKN